MDDIQLEKIQNGSGSKPYQRKNPKFNVKDQLTKVPRPVFKPKKWIYKHVPILDWLPKYTLENGIADVIAGITVALTIIPQGIAYALVAGLPAQFGLYSAFMSCFVFVVLGASKDLSIGPEAILAILTLEVTRKGIEYVILLTFITGITITVLGLFKLGLVIDFMSVPVNAGFTSAAAIVIASSQVPSIFGLAILEKSGLVGFIGTWVDIFRNFGTIRAADTILGLACITILIAMRELKSVNWFKVVMEDQQTSYCQRFWSKIVPVGNAKISHMMTKSMWILSIASNAIVVILSALIAYACDPILPATNSRNTTFILTGNIEAGLPVFQPPPFSINDTTSGEVTSLLGMVTNLGSSVLVIPLIAILANVAIAKSFSHGKPVDASANMLTLGICNILSSFVSSMPVTSSFSRSAVNSASGVRTPLSGLYTGSIVLLALAFLMPFCAYIPKASLGAVIISAVIFLVDYQVVKPMWRATKLDLLSAFVTFLACLFWNLAYGIMVGVTFQLHIILIGIARPKVKVEEQKVDNLPYLLITPDRAILFPSVNFLRTLINKSGLKTVDNSTPVVVDCRHLSIADFTTAKGIAGLISDFKQRSQPLLFLNVWPEVEDILFGGQSNHNDNNNVNIANDEEDLVEKLRALSGRLEAV